MLHERHTQATRRTRGAEVLCRCALPAAVEAAGYRIDANSLKTLSSGRGALPPCPACHCPPTMPFHPPPRSRALFRPESGFLRGLNAHEKVAKRVGRKGPITGHRLRSREKEGKRRDPKSSSVIALHSKVTFYYFKTSGGKGLFALKEILSTTWRGSHRRRVPVSFFLFLS